MEMPGTDNWAHDPKRDVKYNVKAYRKLSDDEIHIAIRMYLSQAKRKPKKGATVTIMSIVGHDAL